MDTRTTQLQTDQFYHIFNRGINKGKIFFERKNKEYFLKQFNYYLNPFISIVAYCLLDNHFHFLIKVRSETEIRDSDRVPKKNNLKDIQWLVSNGFSSFFQGYTRAFNKMYNRTGPLFENRFKRILISDRVYFLTLLSYIHLNPTKHIGNDFSMGYEFSSYNDYIIDDNNNDLIDSKIALNYFKDLESFKNYHLSIAKNFEQ